MLRSQRSWSSAKRWICRICNAAWTKAKTRKHQPSVTKVGVESHPSGYWAPRLPPSSTPFGTAGTQVLVPFWRRPTHMQSQILQSSPTFYLSPLCRSPDSWTNPSCVACPQLSLFKTWHSPQSERNPWVKPVKLISVFATTSPRCEPGDT